MPESEPKKFETSPELSQMKKELQEEYRIAYDTFYDSIAKLDTDVQRVLMSIHPPEKEVERYMQYPIGMLQEIVDSFVFSPRSIESAAVLLTVLEIKKENLS